MNRKDVLPAVIGGAAVVSAIASVGIEKKSPHIASISSDEGIDAFATRLHRGRMRKLRVGTRVPRSCKMVYIGDESAWSEEPIVDPDSNTVMFRTVSDYHILGYRISISGIVDGTLSCSISEGRPMISFDTEHDIRLTLETEEKMNDRGIVKIGFRGFNWFGRRNDDMFTYYSDSFFEKPATEYNPQLMTLAMNLELAACTEMDDRRRRPDSIKRLLKSMGCTKMHVNDVYSESPTIESTDVAVGSKEWNGYNLIFLVLNGAHYSVEFAANVMLGKEGDHAGFLLSCNEGLETLREFIAANGIIGPTKLLIAGYSRTAAGSNLLGRYLSDAIAEDAVRERIGDIELSQKDLYGLSFETPLCGYYEDGMVRPDDERYDSLWYVTNPDDPVTYVPTAAYGFVRYGRRVILNPDHDPVLNRSMLANIEAYLGKDAVSFHDMARFKTVGGLKSMEELNTGFVQKFFDVLGDRRFYHEEIEDDFVNLVYVGRSNLDVLKDIVKESGGILNIIGTMFRYHDDKDRFREIMTPKVEAVTARYGYEEYTKSIVDSAFQLLGQVDRYCEGNIVKFMKDDYLRCMLLNPTRIFKSHYPTMTLSYLMIDDPDYPRPYVAEEQNE
ncbi:MAG: hypothetical protein E7Z64_05830 [Thermoplasmata archaeon]|nr:hypothetical protein [Thermoplasmata archaeon]